MKFGYRARRKKEIPLGIPGVRRSAGRGLPPTRPRSAATLPHKGGGQEQRCVFMVVVLPPCGGGVEALRDGGGKLPLDKRLTGNSSHAARLTSVSVAGTRQLRCDLGFVAEQRREGIYPHDQIRGRLTSPGAEAPGECRALAASGVTVRPRVGYHQCHLIRFLGGFRCESGLW